MAGDLGEFIKSNGHRPAIDCNPPTIAHNTNVAISTALSNWIVVLNSDDLLGTHCIEWLQNKIEYLSPINEHKPFFLRHPMRLSESNEIIRNGNCLHKEVWKAVGGYSDIKNILIGAVKQEIRKNIILSESITIKNRKNGEDKLKKGS
jgi:hypothetical protein